MNRSPVEWLRAGWTVAKSGLHVLGATELPRRLTPKVMAGMLRDRLRGIRGTLAIIHLHALGDPRRPALVFGDTRLDYGELEARIFRLTHALQRTGLGQDRLGLLMHNSHRYFELNAAVGHLAMTSVQIGYRLKPPEVAHILRNSGARGLVFDASLWPTVEPALAELDAEPGRAPFDRTRCLSIGHVAGFAEYEAALAREDASSPAPARGSGNGGVMIYTSGTTGRVKGAARSFDKMGYENILAFLAELPLGADERHLVTSPLYHSAAPALAAMIMATGGCNVILPQFDPEEALRTIERERITSTLVVPTMLGRLMALPPETLRRYDLSSLRWILSGAAPLPTDLARRVEDAMGPVLYNFYGATETGLVSVAHPGEHTSRPGTVGRLIAGNDARICNAQGVPVPPGDVGELYVRNAMLMDGYHDNDAATRDVQRDGFISVGDLATMDADGYLYLVDRKTDMVISGGVNIYPWEIEQRLHEHPAVLEAAVVGVPDAEWGEALAAFVVVRDGHHTDAAELDAHVRETLADYKRPRKVVFLDALPRNATGKILERELRQRLAEETKGA